MGLSRNIVLENAPIMRILRFGEIFVSPDRFSQLNLYISEVRVSVLTIWVNYLNPITAYS